MTTAKFEPFVPTNINVDFAPLLHYDEMEILYNSAWHPDMKIVIDSPLDGMHTWCTESITTFMRCPPWGHIHVNESELAAVLDVGLLAQYRKVSDDKLLESQFVVNLHEKIDKVLRKHEKVKIFARLNECSMKRNKGGVVPFDSALDIIRFMAEDPRVYLWLSGERITSTDIWLSDFDDTVDMQNEWRVFIFGGRVTTISPYQWYKKGRDLNADQLTRFAERIVNFMNEVLSKLPEVSISVTADIICDDPTREDAPIQLIEFNKFGGHTGCGSALFHWKRDEDIMYNQAGQVVIRYFQPAPAIQ